MIWTTLMELLQYSFGFYFIILNRVTRIIFKNQLLCSTLIQFWATWRWIITEFHFWSNCYNNKILLGKLKARYLISHVRQKLKAHGWAKDLIIHVHDLVLVTTRVQVVHSVLNDVQTLMARGLQVILSRQIRP